MKSPSTDVAEWLVLPEIDSTQNLACELARKGDPAPVVYAHHQTQGRGRFDREWVSQSWDSLTMSLTFAELADHPAPHLIGMSVAIAAAGALHLRLQWPNDLVLNGLKVGGILTDVVADPKGRLVAVVGLGLNLNQTEFPVELRERATSLLLQTGRKLDAMETAAKVLKRLKSIPDAENWSELAPLWQVFDSTAGKQYVLPSGDVAVALGVGSDAQLLCSINGESAAVPVADALFGPSR